MNKRQVIRLLGAILLVEAACMAPSLVVALIYRDPGDAAAMLYSMLIVLAAGLPMRLLAKPKHTNLRAREGFAVVGLSWVLMSLFGALPFVFSGMLPNYVDAFFEAVSGFTTTGSTVVADFDHLPHGCTFWRSFTHWVGGMGVLVLTLAVLPKLTGRTSHLVRAESPGPSLSKIAPKMGDTAKILYRVYAAMSASMFVLLMVFGMSPYDAAIHTFGTAGTGGFSNYGASIAAFHSPAIEVVITVYMLLFGVNLALFYSLFTGSAKDFFRSEELKWYLGMSGGAILICSLCLLPVYGSFSTALRYGAFQVATIVSTTGFATTDFNLWPIAVKAVLLVLMFVGSCAGSTAGGMKVVRVALLFKQGKREIASTFQPRKMQVVRFEGKGVDENMLHRVTLFAFLYVLLVLIGGLLVSLGGQYDLLTNFTAALTCVSNVGPGFGEVVGPVGNFAGFSPFSKLVLSLLMLAGRLELYPILVLFHPSLWHKA